MTEKIYEQAPFLVKFEAKVLSCEKGKKGFDIVLDRTAFYPEGEVNPGTPAGWRYPEPRTR